MKMSDVKFNVQKTEGSLNIDTTLKAIGHESVAAIEYAVDKHDQLTAINQELVEALSELLSRVSNDSESKHWFELEQMNAEKAIKRAKAITQHTRDRVFIGAWSCDDCHTKSAGSAIADNNGRCPKCKSDEVKRIV